MQRVHVPVILALTALCGPMVGPAAADLRCTPAAADLGEIRGGPTRQARFELVNDGKLPIEIVDIERGCGCLETRLDRQALKPGEKATLLIDLRTAGQSNGPRGWNLRIRFRDGGTIRETLLVVAATIRNEVTVQPSILALHVQDVLRQEVSVIDLRKSPLKVQSVVCSLSAVRATIQASNGGVTTLLLEAAASALPDGRHDGLLSIYTDDSLYGLLEVPISVTRAVKLALAVTPAAVQLRVSADQPVASALVRLRLADGHKIGIEAIKIEAVEADDTGLTCTWAAGPGDSATLKVQADARRLETRDGPRTIRVRLSEPKSGVVTIPVSIDRLNSGK